MEHAGAVRGSSLGTTAAAAAAAAPLVCGVFLTMEVRHALRNVRRELKQGVRPREPAASLA